AVKLAPLRRRRRGERGAVKLAPLRRRRRGERVDASGALWGCGPESVVVPGDGRWRCRRSVCTAGARVGLGSTVCLGAAAAGCGLARSGPAAEWARQERGDRPERGAAQ